MTTEEKAKAYDDALKRAKAILKVADNRQESLGYVSTIFPELAESENEKIRKEIVRFIQMEVEDEIVGNKWLAWLEKQGEKPQGKSVLEAINEEKVDNRNCVKTTDKVELKFKVGDYIVNDYCAGRVVALTDDAYLLDTEQGIPFSCEHNVHLWTIQDAKDGDVLISQSGNPLIYNGNYNSFNIGAYCGMTCDDNKFKVAEEKCHWTENVDIKPSNKEQCDKLFKAMKEAGYEWDAEKKELKKIEEPINDEDYGIDGLYHAQIILEKTLGNVDGYQTDDGILEHECAIAAVNKLYKQKPTWSDEDERMRQETIDWFVNKCFPYALEEENPARESIKWLKSLKDRVSWKPSKKQMETLEYYMHTLLATEHKEVLFGLYNDLKKL